MDSKRLYRTEGSDAKVAGVCGGIAEYFGMDPTILRVVWAVLALVYGVGLLAYLICAIVIPKKSTIYPGY